MEFRRTHRFDYPLDAVYSLLLDRTHAAEKYAALGEPVLPLIAER